MALDFSDRAVPAPLDFSNRAVPGDTAAPPAPAGFRGQTPVADLVSAEPPSVVDRFLSNTAIGRVMAAFGQGAEEGFGDDPLGLSDETAEEMRRIGLFPKVNEGISGSLKLFNEALIRPAAAGLDALMRGAEAVAVGTAVAAGQVAEEFGATETQGRRLSRDVLMLADTVGVLTGTSPTAIRRIRGREVKPKVQGAEQPKLPTELYDKSDVAVVDKAGNINLDRIQAPEDVKDVIRQAAVEGDEFTKARRGTISLAQTEEMADALGMSAEELTKRRVGQAFNAEEAVAARNLLVQSATKVRELAVKAAGGSDNDLMAFQEAVTRHMAIQEQVAGLTAEAGRALSSFRILARGTEEAKDLGHVIEALGGRGNIETVARAIRELDTPGQVSKFVMDTRNAKFSDMVLEAWINALLSGPQTHMTNIVSNALFAFWAIPETAVAATIGGVRRLAGSAEEAVMFGEAGARAWGFVQGAKEGVIAGWRAFKTEMPSDPQTKLDVRRQRAIPSKTVEVGGFEFELGGKQIRIPGRALMAEDEFFKAIGYRQELNALAYRQAAREGLRGRAFQERVAQLVNHPTAEMTRKARENAEVQTFTNPLGKFGQAVQQAANAHPSVRFVIPFIRTPVNILKQGLKERTPLGLFSQEVRANLSGKNGAIARDQQAARLLVGSSVGAAMVALAAEGYVTGGGPTDPRERALLYATGWQPYSVRIGDMWYSYARLEPFAMVLGVSADMYEIGNQMTDAELSDMAALVTASVSKNLINKTWLSGPADLIQAVSDPDRYGERYVERFLSTAIPTGVAQVARTQDPILRDARDALDAIKARVPGLSTDLLPRRDIWGEPIELGGSLGPDLLSPIYQSRINNDPVNQELLELGIYPAKLDRKIRGVELTPEQYDEYQRLAGRFAKYQLDGLVALEGWRDLPPFARREAITNTIRKARETARSLMLMRHPGIIEEATRARVKEITGSANLP